MTLSAGQAAIAGMILAVWLAAAAWALVSGMTLRRRANADGETGQRLAAMLSASPALPIIVAPDGRIDMAERLTAWLGLPRRPAMLADLDAGNAGLDEEATRSLIADVAAAQRTGKAFTRVVRVRGSSRTLTIRGAPSPVAMTGEGVLLWVFDATEAQAEIERLRTEAERLGTAFEALSRLIEAAPVPMWHRGPDLRLTLVNRAYVEAVEAESADDVIARGVELVEAAGGVGPIAAAAAARDADDVSARVVPATIAGQRRSVRIVDVPLGAAGVAGYAIDNEELDRARGALRRFADTQRDTLDRLSAGVAQFASDKTLSFSNRPFQRMFSLKAEWVADRPEFDRVLDRMREAGRIPDGRDFPAWKAERRDWFLSSEGAVEEQWQLPGGAYLRVVAQPLPDGGLLVIFEDQTEQLKLASAHDTLLRVREATFDNLFEAVGVFAADGRLHLWNNRFRDVWSFDETLLVGNPHVDALTEAAAPSLSSPQRASLIRELVRAATVDRQARAGRVALRDGRHFEFAAVPLPDGNALFTMLDITDSRRIERVLRDRAEALEAADKVKTAFVANMSYELRTPLTSIGGFAEMLDHGYAGKLSKQAKDYVKAILTSVARLGSMVDDVLQLTQSEGDVAGSDRETIDLRRLLDAATREAAKRSEGRGQEVILEMPAGIDRIEGDGRRLREAVDGLLDHAVDTTQAGGRILVHAEVTRDGMRIVVSDNGPGEEIAEDGIVAHARRIIQSMGGTTTVLADPGEGTAIAIALPR